MAPTLGPAKNAGQIHGVPVAKTAPANTQVLKYNSTTGMWEPGSDVSGIGGATGAVDEAILVADGTGGSTLKTSSKTIQTTLTDDDTKVPTGGAVKDALVGTEIVLSKLGTSTQEDLQDWVNDTQSGGRVYGGVISASATPGTIDVSAMKGMIKIADFTQGVQAPSITKFFDFAGESAWGATGTGTTLVDNAINYIYIDYNSGTPKLLCTTTRSAIRYTDQFNIGRVFKDGDDIEVLTSGVNLYNRSRLIHERWIDTFGGLSRANGVVPSCSGTTSPKPKFTEGVLYAGSNKISLSEIDCAGAGRFAKFYFNPTSGLWVESSADQTTLDITHYNDAVSGTGLSTLPTSGQYQYGIHWLYVCPEGEMYVMYGKAAYSLAGAQAATVATPIPNYLSQWALLVAKVIVHQSTGLVSVTSAWTNQFPVQIAGNHSDLGHLDFASSGHSGFAPATQKYPIRLDVGGGKVATGMLTPVQYWKTVERSNGIVDVVMEFPAGGSNAIYFDVDLPSECADDALITLWPVFEPLDAQAGNVQFLVYAKRFTTDDARNVAVSTLVLTTGATATTSTAGDIIVGTESSGFVITGTGKRVTFKVMRKTDDTYPGSVYLHAMPGNAIVVKA